MRFHLKHISIIRNTNKQNNECWQGCGEMGTLMHCRGNVKGCSHNGNSMAGPQNIKNVIALRTSNPISGCISKRIQSRISKRYLHTYVDCSIIHNSQEVEETLMSIDMNG